MQKNQSQWTQVIEKFRRIQPINFGKYVSYWFHKSPGRVLRCLSYYKFAAKLIGNQKRILDLGCNEGIGTYLLGKECGFAKGIDFDEAAIQKAKENFPENFVSFDSQDILQTPGQEQWDAVVSFDVIEHILPENSHEFFYKILSHLKPEGLVVIGTPSPISQEFASKISKKGHVNIYSHERLEETLRRFFQFVFLFAANDEIIHTGFLPLAHYLIAIGCKKT